MSADRPGWQQSWRMRKPQDIEDIEVSKTSDLSVSGKIVGDTQAIITEGRYKGIGEGYVIEVDNFTIPPTTMTVSKDSKTIRRK